MTREGVGSRHQAIHFLAHDVRDHLEGRCVSDTRREEQEQAARELSFSESNVKQAGVLKPEAEPAQASADSAAARGALKPSKTIVPNEEEVITTKRADVLAEAGAKAGTPGQVESRPGAGEPPVDDVEAAVEKAIQDKLKAERDSEAGVLGSETSGE